MLQQQLTQDTNTTFRNASRRYRNNANTKIANIIGNTVSPAVDNNVTITEGDDIKIYLQHSQDATFMSANTVITTREDSPFAIDGSRQTIR